MTKTNTLVVCFLACIVGVYSGRFVELWAVSLLFGVLLCAIGRVRLSLFLVSGLALITLSVGNLRGSYQNKGFDLMRDNFGEKVVVVGTSLDDAEYNSRGQLSFSMNNLVIDGVAVPGQIAVSGFGETNVQRGDSLEVEGKLFETRGANQARVSFASLDILAKDSEWYNTFRRQMTKKLRDTLPEPESSFATGLLIGQRSTIPDSIIGALRITGLAHIIAVSGYNLTILVRFIMKVFGKTSRYQRLLAASVLIWVFLLITGFSASITRAALVSYIALGAWYYGRTLRAAVLLSFSAMVTVLYKPEYVWGDAGWYLSFLAFSGILIVSPIIKNRIYGNKEPRIIGRLFIETSAVLLMVSPYSIYLFETFSLIALPSNLLVVPLIPVAMFLLGLLLILPSWIPVIALSAEIVLSTILEIALWLSRFEYASLEVRLSLWEMIMFYGALIMMVYIMWRKTKIPLNSSVLLQ